MKTIRLLQKLFLAFGILMLVGTAAIVVNREKFLHRAVTVQGTIVGNDLRYDSRGSGTYYPQFAFITRDGQPIIGNSNAGSNPPSFSAGEAVTVYYDPANPHDAKISSFAQLWMGALILGFLGVVFTGVGFAIRLYGNRGATRRAKLLQNGQQIVARVTGVERNGSVQVNGNYPFHVIAQWQDPTSNKLYVFHSDNLWFDPSEWVKEGQAVTVLIEPGNPKKYSMDTSFCRR
jgi:Protein of unknown function (DUF3592)